MNFVLIAFIVVIDPMIFATMYHQPREFFYLYQEMETGTNIFQISFEEKHLKPEQT